MMEFYIPLSYKWEVWLAITRFNSPFCSGEMSVPSPYMTIVFLSFNVLEFLTLSFYEGLSVLNFPWSSIFLLFYFFFLQLKQIKKFFMTMDFRMTGVQWFLDLNTHFRHTSLQVSSSMTVLSGNEGFW